MEDVLKQVKKDEETLHEDGILDVQVIKETVSLVEEVMPVIYKQGGGELEVTKKLIEIKKAQILSYYAEKGLTLEAPEITEENLQDYKDIRSELNKQIKAESAGITKTKADILSDFTILEKEYKEKPLKALDDLVVVVGKAVNEFDENIVTLKENECKAHWAVLCEEKGIDWLPFEKLMLKVNKSTTLKSLTEEMDNKAGGIEGDLSIIENVSNPERVLAKYKEGNALAEALRLVKEEVAKEEEILEREATRLAELAQQETNRLAEEAARQEKPVDTPTTPVIPTVPNTPEESLQAPATPYERLREHEHTFTPTIPTIQGNTDNKLEKALRFNLDVIATETQVLQIMNYARDIGAQVIGEAKQVEAPTRSDFF